MESANILQAVEQYRRELETVTTTNLATRVLPTHESQAVTKMREFHQVGQELWGHRDNGHA
jgi:hypothetical protein